MERIAYRCKKCNWQASIVAQWADVKPKLCPGPKCKTNFRLNPDQLEITLPEPDKPVVKKKYKKEQEKDNG